MIWSLDEMNSAEEVELFGNRHLDDLFSMGLMRDHGHGAVGTMPQAAFATTTLLFEVAVFVGM